MIIVQSQQSLCVSNEQLAKLVVPPVAMFLVLNKHVSITYKGMIDIDRMLANQVRGLFSDGNGLTSHTSFSGGSSEGSLHQSGTSSSVETVTNGGAHATTNTSQTMTSHKGSS